jgi:hypothetical protein
MCPLRVISDALTSSGEVRCYPNGDRTGSHSEPVETRQWRRFGGMASLPELLFPTSSIPNTAPAPVQGLMSGSALQFIGLLKAQRRNHSNNQKDTY